MEPISVQTANIAIDQKDFADSLQTEIWSSSPGALNVTDENLRALDKHIERFPLSWSILSVSNRRLLEASGAHLWNTCVQALEGRDNASERRVLRRAIFFSFDILESVASRRGPGNWRMLEIALMTAKFFLKMEYLEFGLRTLETAAARLDSLEKSEPAETSELSTIMTEYYILRVYLSWLQGRPDIAEHFFKTSKPLENLSARKTIVEICYNIGVSALSKNQPDVSLVWLGRALYPSLWSEAIEETDPTLKDLRLLSLHAFVRTHLQLNTPDSWNYVKDGLNSLQIEISNDQERKEKYTLPVTVLQLEIFNREQQPNYEKYSECLRALIQAMDVTEDCLSVALYHARIIGSWSVGFSMEIFQQLLRAIPRKNQVLIDHCFVTFFWVVTVTGKRIDQDLDTIANILSSLEDHGCNLFSEEACHASLALIWRQIEHAISANEFSIAEKWCLLALDQPLFENCSTDNRVIFQRKQLLCAIENHSLITHTTLAEILQRYRDNPSTLCLVYKLASLHGYNDLTATAEVFIRAGVSSIDT